MNLFCVIFILLSMSTTALGQATLEKDIAALRNAGEVTVAIKPMTFSEAIKFGEKEKPTAVEMRAELDRILGGSVLMLRPIRQNAKQTSVARIPAIFSDPSDPAQQATYRIGDRLEITGMLINFDSKLLPKKIASNLTNVDLSAYEGDPTIIITRLISMPPAAVPAPAANTNGVQERGDGNPQPTSNADSINTRDAAVAPAQPQPQPQQATGPASQAPTDGPRQNQTTGQPAQEVLVREVPRQSSLFVPAPLVLVENPVEFINKTVTFDAITENAPGGATMRLIFDVGSPDDDLLAFRKANVPAVERGARVRVTGNLTTLALDDIERRTGLIIDRKLWLADIEAPRFLIDSIEVLQEDRFDN